MNKKLLRARNNKQKSSSGKIYGICQFLVISQIYLLNIDDKSKKMQLILIIWKQFWHLVHARSFVKFFITYYLYLVDRILKYLGAISTTKFFSSLQLFYFIRGFYKTPRIQDFPSKSPTHKIMDEQNQFSHIIIIIIVHLYFYKINRSGDEWLNFVHNYYLPALIKIKKWFL